ncbi:MAG: hypothetical protein K2H26_02635 [Ruminococcus sp.]|nr:hypothetical protein [Ruminococcus sp.]
MFLDELISRIRQRAGAFLGNDINLKSLFHFIDGFLFAKANSGIPDKYGQVFRYNFRKFLISELGITEYDQFGFWYEILEYAYSDDAWNKFFEMWDKFCEKNFLDKNSADK